MYPSGNGSWRPGQSKYSAASRSRHEPEMAAAYGRARLIIRSVSTAMPIAVMPVQRGGSKKITGPRRHGVAIRTVTATDARTDGRAGTGGTVRRLMAKASSLNLDGAPDRTLTASLSPASAEIWEALRAAGEISLSPITEEK